MCLPLSAEPRRLEMLFVALKVQAAVVGAGALALLIGAVRAALREGSPTFRAVHAAGLVLLAFLLARRAFGTYTSLFRSESGGLGAIAAEISLFWRVVVACAAVIALGAIGLYVSRGRALHVAKGAG
jgi:uncharacterized BrkB/YihY/UPF0761 family membrane protein